MSFKILIVDDERDILVTLQDLLEFEGYEVVCAYNGTSALLKIEETNPDLIITDMMMPGMNGIELIQAIRNDKDYSTIPIILLSAMISLMDQEKQGWDVFIKKPSDIFKLLDSVHDLLTKGRSQRS